MDVELLVVPDCPHETAAVQLLSTALLDLGLLNRFRITVITGGDQAEQRRFTGSPTFLIAGIDPFADPGRPIGVSCRIYRQGDGFKGVPGLTELREALRHAADPGTTT